MVWIALNFYKKSTNKPQKIIELLIVSCKMHIAEEETKFGLDQEELDILNSTELQEMKNTAIVDGNGKQTDQNQIKKEFLHLKIFLRRHRNLKKKIIAKLFSRWDVRRLSFSN
jgi:hypothetical protein